MLEYLLFIIYFLLLAYFLRKNRIIRSSGFSDIILLLLFTIKVFAGIAIGWMSATYYSQGNDYWTLHSEGIAEHQLLLTHPRQFISSIFHSPYENEYGRFFNSVGSYWNDLKNNIIIKILAVLNIFSRGSYYINSLFLNAFCFVGTVAMASVFMRFTKNKWAVIIGCFLVPSTLYFSSGIHKDLFVFTLLGYCIYTIYHLLYHQQTFRLWAGCILSLLCLFIFRNIVVLMLIPPILFLILRKKYGFSNFTSLAFSLSICAVMLCLLHVTAADPLQMIVQKQKDFLDLGIAFSQLPLEPLQPTFISFLKNTPQAFNHAYMRPYVWEYPGHFLMIMSFELAAIHLLIIAAIFKKNSAKAQSFWWFTLFFGILMISTAGYIVPNTGSIVRYRSLYLPFIVTPLLCILSQRRS